MKHITTAAGNLRWMMPVTNNTKKVYPGAQDETAANFFEDIVVRTQAGLMEDLGNSDGYLRPRHKFRCG